MPDWLRHVLPWWAEGFVDWLLSPAVLAVISVASIVMALASVLGVPWFVRRIPGDYFCRDGPRSLGIVRVESPWLRKLVRVGKNVLGVVLVVAGLAMLVLPGQGLITLFVALVLLDFPGKLRLARRIVFSPKVSRVITRLRQKAGKPPLERGPADE